MVGKGKANQELDGISKLPDDLIYHMLSILPTKEAVKTSVLSTRWNHLWLGLANMELKSRDFSDPYTFMSFGDRVFDSSRVSWIHKLRLTIDHNENVDDDYLASWLDAAIKRKIKHLHVSSYCYGDRMFQKMPPILFNCETLVCLKLFQLTLHDNEFAYHCLPRLKTMHLEYIDFPNEATFETLILCCPVLEDLKIVVANDDEKAFRVHSPSLKSLTFERISSLFNSAVAVKVVIDAPRLCFLRINDNVSKSFLVENLDESNGAMLEMSLVFGMDWDEHNNYGYDDEEEMNEAMALEMRRSSIRSFLLGISMVKSMIILCEETFKLICRYSNLEPLPQFGYISSLRITLFLSDFQWLPTFLKSFPNLKSLILVRVDDHYKKIIDEEDSSSVPPAECLLSSLEFVELIVPVRYFVEVKLVKYLLKKSAILQKITLALDSCSKKDDLFKKLLKTPRASTKCKVIIL